jgi:hypothetical protein
MAKKSAAGAKHDVLPKSSSSAGGKAIRSVDQILTDKQRTELRSDLTEMARLRREAEASSGTLRFS